MFGCIVAGRQIQTNLQQVAPGKYVFILPEPTKINHLVIFVTDPFEVGFGASLYYNTARQQAAGTAWQFLGVLTNDKPSAIFRVKQPTTSNGMEDVSLEDYGEVGISIEPLSVLESLSNEKALVLASAPAQSDAKSILQKIAESAFNYMSSFVKPAVMYGQEQVVPLKSLQDWYNSTLRKASSDPQFAFKS